MPYRHLKFAITCGFSLLHFFFISQDLYAADLPIPLNEDCISELQSNLPDLVPPLTLTCPHGEGVQLKKSPFGPTVQLKLPPGTMPIPSGMSVERWISVDSDVVKKIFAVPSAMALDSEKELTKFRDEPLEGVQLKQWLDTVVQDIATEQNFLNIVNGTFGLSAALESLDGLPGEHTCVDQVGELSVVHALDTCITRVVLELVPKKGLTLPAAFEAGFIAYLKDRRIRKVETHLKDIAQFAGVKASEFTSEYAHRMMDRISVCGGSIAGLERWSASFRGSGALLEEIYHADRIPDDEIMDPDFGMRSDAVSTKASGLDGVPGRGGSEVRSIRVGSEDLFYKYNPTDPEESLREYAAFRLDKLLETQLIPHTRLVKIDEEGRRFATAQASAQKLGFVQGKGNNPSEFIEQYKVSEAFLNMQVIDFLMNHKDRHTGNLFYKKVPTAPAEYSIVAIDNGGDKKLKSFELGVQVDPQDGAHGFSGDRPPEKYPPALRDRLTSLKAEDLHRSLAFLPPSKVEGVIMRLHVLQEDLKRSTADE